LRVRSQCQNAISEAMLFGLHTIDSEHFYPSDPKQAAGKGIF
jgi:hypothetical protein